MYIHLPGENKSKELEMKRWSTTRKITGIKKKPPTVKKIFPTAHTPVSTRSTVNARELTNDDDTDVDSDEDNKDENKPSDVKSEISDVSDIGSEYGSIENEDEEKASSSIIELSGDSSDAASSFLPTPPRRRGRYTSSSFSPRVDENTRPHSLRHTNSVTPRLRLVASPILLNDVRKTVTWEEPQDDGIIVKGYMEMPRPRKRTKRWYAYFFRT